MINWELLDCIWMIPRPVLWRFALAFERYLDCKLSSRHILVVPFAMLLCAWFFDFQRFYETLLNLGSLLLETRKLTLVNSQQVSANMIWILEDYESRKYDEVRRTTLISLQGRHSIR